MVFMPFLCTVYWRAILSMKVAIYARVSTREKGQDPENQVHQLRTFAEQHGTLYKVFTEEVSGGKSDRLQFKQLLLEAYQGLR